LKQIRVAKGSFMNRKVDQIQDQFREGGCIELEAL